MPRASTSRGSAPMSPTRSTGRGSASSRSRRSRPVDPRDDPRPLGAPRHREGQARQRGQAAAQLVASLPADWLSPETTEEREGYAPARVSGNAEEAIVDFIARDHDDELSSSTSSCWEAWSRESPSASPGRRSTSRSGLVSQHAPLHRAAPRVVEAALEAIRRSRWSRGWRSRAVARTERCSALGLPTPNIFTGGQQYHSVREWASVQDMAAAAATIVHLAEVWGRRRSAGVRARSGRVPRSSGSTTSRSRSQTSRRSPSSGGSSTTSPCAVGSGT